MQDGDLRSRVAELMPQAKADLVELDAFRSVADHQQQPPAEILLYGVEEPACLIHAPNESVAPSEIEQLALARRCSYASPERQVVDSRRGLAPDATAVDRRQTGSMCCVRP